MRKPCGDLPAVGPHLSLKVLLIHQESTTFSPQSLGGAVHSTYRAKGVLLLVLSSSPLGFLGGLGNFFTYSLAVPMGVKARAYKPFLLKYILLLLLLCCSPQMLLQVRFIIFILFIKKYAPQHVFLSTPQRCSFTLVNQQIFLKAAM